MLPYKALCTEKIKWNITRVAGERVSRMLGAAGSRPECRARQPRTERQRAPACRPRTILESVLCRSPAWRFVPKNHTDNEIRKMPFDFSSRRITVLVLFFSKESRLG